MPGLIEQVLGLGLERKELIKDHPKAMIGGARIPYPPKDMASLITILKGRNVRNYLALEATTDGGVNFLEAHLHILNVTRFEAKTRKRPRPQEEGSEGEAAPEKETNASEKDFRKMLRIMPEPFDLISIDGRGLPLDVETIWRYIQGGRDDYTREFGKGAPVDFGIPKLRPGGSIIINLTDPIARTVWYKIRARHSQSYQSPFVGMANVAAH